jgi:hypothetical protein
LQNHDPASTVSAVTRPEESKCDRAVVQSLSNEAQPPYPAGRDQVVTAPVMLASSECRYNKDDFLHAVG